MLYDKDEAKDLMLGLENVVQACLDSQIQKLNALVTRAQYDELLAEGFSSEEALVLTCALVGKK